MNLEEVEYLFVLCVGFFVFLGCLVEDCVVEFFDGSIKMNLLVLNVIIF